jgi:hypothetical protein
MFSTFPEDARWNAERRAVEFAGRDRRVPRGGSGAAARDPRATAGAAHPEPCVEANYLQRTRFECIAAEAAPAPIDRGWECQVTGGDRREWEIRAHYVRL